MAKGSCPTRELTGHVFPSVALEQPLCAVRDVRGCLGAPGGGGDKFSDGAWAAP